MAPTLADALRDTVRRRALLGPGDRVLVGVSGGADSVALVAALQELSRELSVTVAAAHLDHGLRGAEGAADRTLVERVTREVGVPVHCEAVRLPSGNVEVQARRARYDFLERAAAAWGATRIATAHTADDQAETVLLRLLAGAGRRGLGGIPPRRGAVIRPLIDCDRVQVRAYLVARGLPWARDRSNFDLRLARTRVRAGFLPALAREFNPRLPRALARLADLLREEDAVLDRLAARACGRGAELATALLRDLEPAIARRAVRRWWRRHGSGHRLTAGHVDAVLTLAGGTGEAERRLPGGTVLRSAGTLRFRPGADGEPRVPAYARTLAVGGAVDLPGGWRLALAGAARADAPAPSPTICVLDAAAAPATLTVRNRRAGDRIRALGLGGHASIKRLMIARGVPRGRRAAHPLVLMDEEVVWVPRCARSEHALVGPGTTHVLVVRVEQEPAPRA